MGMNEMREKIAKHFNYQDKLTRATVKINEHDSWLMTSLAQKSNWLEKADALILSLETKTHRIAVIKKGEDWLSPEDCIACQQRQRDSERILCREAAFEEQRLMDEVNYWKNERNEV